MLFRKLPDVKIGILGAGQLGRMLALAGYPLGLEFIFLDPAEEACAAPLGKHLRADYTNEAALAEFCADIDVATFEFENVPQHAAEFVAARVPLWPSARALTAGQDRLSEKALFTALGIPVPRHAAVDTLDDLATAAATTSLPAILKTRRMGYDGKGQAVLRSPADFTDAWRAVGGQPSILEAFIPFQREVSCLLVRDRPGASVCYPLVQNVHRSGILHLSIPQPADPLQTQAEDYARRVATHLDYCGVLAFEFFVADGQLIANEIAPRVHNSGHWSIEGAETSQFENHLRAIAGLPLGSTALRGASAMLNFIGTLPPLPALAALPGVHVHDYGKTAKPLRKVGHATVTAETAAEFETRLATLLALLPAP